jgi:hypothetical protein
MESEDSSIVGLYVNVACLAFFRFAVLFNFFVGEFVCWALFIGYGLWCETV